jgi:hypothetical protein
MRPAAIAIATPNLYRPSRRPPRVRSPIARVPRLAATILALALVTPPATAQASNPLVKEITLWRRDAGRAAWSAQGDWVAFSLRSPDRGNYQLHTVKRDGTFEHCLTCEPL